MCPREWVLGALHRRPKHGLQGTHSGSEKAGAAPWILTGAGVHTGGILTRFQRDRGTRATLTVAGVCGLDTGTSSASQSQVCWPFSGSGPHMPPLQPQEQ